MSLRKFKFQDPSFSISTYDYDPRFAYVRGQAVSKDGSVIHLSSFKEYRPEAT